MTHEEAIAKVAKLLRLAQSDNPNEAALAASRAQEIMDRFKIDQLSVEAELNGAAEQLDEPIIDCPEPLEDKQRSTWVIRLIVALARANQCRPYVHMPGVYLVGRPSDIQAVRYLYGWLKREVNRLAARDGKAFGAIWKNNFRLGVVDTVVEKLKQSQEETKRAMQVEAANPHAIVLVQRALVKLEERGKAVDLWVAQHKRLTGTHKRGVAQGDYGARAAGQRAGHEIKLGAARGALGAAPKTLKG